MLTPVLKTAIDALYVAFASVPRPKTIEACPCCIEDQELHTLLTRPRRDITPDELSSYASSVLLTVGGEADFRHYVPRIVDILVTVSGWWPNPEVFGARLADANWLDWPEAQCAAVLRVLDARFDEAIAANDGDALDSLLCGFACAKLDLCSYLARIASAPDAVLAVYLHSANEIFERRLNNPFWDDAPEGRQLVVDWFYSTDISLLILKTYGVDLNAPRL